MTPEPPSVQTVDLPLGTRRQTLRLTLTRDESGAPQSLVLASGFGGGDTNEPFIRPGWYDAPLALPADILPELREALRELEPEVVGP